MTGGVKRLRCTFALVRDISNFLAAVSFKHTIGFETRARVTNDLMKWLAIVEGTKTLFTAQLPNIPVVLCNVESVCLDTAIEKMLALE